MRKVGFTLAEVLITLGIIGVIAAITLPTLMTDTTSAQIGPKLAKGVAMFEQANEALLNANSVDSLEDTGFILKLRDSYADEIEKYLKVATLAQLSSANYKVLDGIGVNSQGNGVGACNILNLGNINSESVVTLQSKDGMFYHLSTNGRTVRDGRPSHESRVGAVYIDINGRSKPNVLGTDVFAFTWWADGSLRPVGGANWNDDIGTNSTTCQWRTQCPLAEDGVVTDYKACTGHVFENNLKALYR